MRMSIATITLLGAVLSPHGAMAAEPTASAGGSLSYCADGNRIPGTALQAGHETAELFCSTHGGFMKAAPPK